jgi:hypothetical protein
MRTPRARAASRCWMSRWLRDPDHHSGQGAAAVAFQAKLVFEGVEGALDPLAQRPSDPTRRGASARSGPSKTGPWAATSCSKSANSPRPLTWGVVPAARESNPQNRQIRSLVLRVGLVNSRRIWAAHVECLLGPYGSRRNPSSRLDDQADVRAPGRERTAAGDHGEARTEHPDRADAPQDRGRPPRIPPCSSASSPADRSPGPPSPWPAR